MKEIAAKCLAEFNAKFPSKKKKSSNPHSAQKKTGRVKEYNYPEDVEMKDRRSSDDATDLTK